MNLWYLREQHEYSPVPAKKQKKEARWGQLFLLLMKSSVTRIPFNSDYAGWWILIRSHSATTAEVTTSKLAVWKWRGVCPAGIESIYWETSSLPYIGTSVMYYRVEGEEYNSSVTWDRRWSAVVWWESWRVPSSLWRGRLGAYRIQTLRSQIIRDLCTGWPKLYRLDSDPYPFLNLIWEKARPRHSWSRSSTTSLRPVLEILVTLFL